MIAQGIRTTYPLTVAQRLDDLISRAFRAPMDGAFRPPFGGAVDAAVDWWLSGGINPIGRDIIAYLAKGAASYAASKINLADPGTNDATEGTAPDWAIGVGWSFDGLNLEYLDTGYILPNDHDVTVIIKYVNASVTQPICGSSDAANRRFAIWPNFTATNVTIQDGGTQGTAPVLPTGIYAISDGYGYRNGVKEGSQCGAWAAPAAASCTVGGRNPVGASSASTVDIVSFSLYKPKITDVELAAVVAAMATQ